MASLLTSLDEYEWARVRRYIESLTSNEAWYRATEPGDVFAVTLARIALRRNTNRRLSKALIREALKWADTPMNQGDLHAADPEARVHQSAAAG